MKSVIYIEKLEHKPGIYIIFNLKTQRIYIGQATRLKERALQHVKNLYLNCDDNASLREEFSGEANEYYLGCLCQLESTEYLDQWESIYYLAAIDLFDREMVYNIRELNNEKNQLDKIEKAKNVLKNALKRKTKGTEKYTNTRFSKMKDWIETDVVEELGLKTKSIKQMFENSELDFLLFAKAGDYIGDEKPQTISEILREKVCDLNRSEFKSTKRCLWATSGPRIGEFSEFYSLYKKKYGEQKKLYVLFKLTINAYSTSKEQKRYFWKKDGAVYTDTAPSSNTVKALVLNNFYVIEEDFEFEQFTKMYYRYARPAYHSTENKYMLNSDNTARQTLYPAVSKALIMDKVNEDIREALGFSGANSYLLDELQEKNCIEHMKKFPDCNKEEHPFYFILAEVEDYVQLHPIVSSDV